MTREVESFDLRFLDYESLFGDSIIIWGFIQSCEIILQNCNNESLIFPFFYNLRHSLELIYKKIIRQQRKILEYYNIKIPSQMNLDNTHCLKSLFQELDSNEKRISKKENIESKLWTNHKKTFSDVLDVFEKFENKNGTNFKYSRDKDNKILRPFENETIITRSEMKKYIDQVKTISCLKSYYSDRVDFIIEEERNF